MDMQEPVGMCRCPVQRVQILQNGHRKAKKVCIGKMAYHRRATR
jgi:hypothetical protein